MRGKIYKSIASISKEEILQNCEFENEIPEYGDIFTYNEFKESIDCYAITDYDGSGDIMLDGKVVKNATIWIGDKTVFFRDKLFVPFDVVYSLFGDDFKVIWFNK